MQRQTAKRVKKEVFVYERGIDLWTMLGELTEDQAGIEGLMVNQEKTQHMRKVMAVLISEVKKEFAPGGITDEETLHYVNNLVKEIFADVVQSFDYNKPFYGNRGELIKAIKIIRDRLIDEKEMIELAEYHENMLLSMHDIEENFY